MSSPESPRRIVLSRRARQDFVDILRFTRETWGPAQSYVYRDKIDAALRSLAAHPLVGRVAAEISDRHRIVAVGTHVIVYRVQGEDVVIVRMLHQRMRLPWR